MNMSSSESDDETYDAQPTAQPLKQNQKVPSRNEQYQNLVNAKNKFSEMLKNKIKQSERTSININDDYEFNPVASSTQINTPDELKREKKKQKKAGTPFKLTNLLHTDESPIKQKKKRFKKNEVINISSTIMSSSSNSESDEPFKKPAQSREKKNADSSEESKSESSSGSSSDGTTNRVNQIQNNKNTIKFSKLENLRRHSNAKRKSSVSSDESSENEKSNLQSTFSSKEKKKVVQKSSSESQSDSQEEENSNYKITKNSRFNVEKQAKSNLQEPSSESSDSDTKSNYQRHLSPNKINKFSGSKEAISSFQNKPNPLNKIQKRSNSSETSSSYSSSDEFVEQKIKPPKAENTPISHLTSYEEESSFQKISGANDFLRDIKSNEEIFLLQVPIKIDPQSLVGVNISLSEAIKIPQRKKYDSVPMSEAPGNMALFCNSTDDRIRIVKPVRYIKIQRRLKNKTVAEVPDLANQSVSFPHNLKQRHPLFGSEFAKKIQLEEHVKQKLEAAEHTRHIKIKKKEKKKKMQAVKKEEDQKEEIFKLLNQSISSVAPTTSKNNEKLQYSEDSDNAREKQHKKKKKKSKQVEEDVSKFNAKKKKKMKSKEYQSSEEESRSDVKKRKNVDLETSNSSQKKSKNDSENDSLIKQLLSLENASLYKKKKKKRKLECQDE